ncbi:T6SS immunity protein Tdi1 domain-containing protein [Nocardia aurantia]|uniref:T6SS immunity protein Tdi1 domain-containing protein n=1 Tax=Nocardia aurantia TaxID=2585199 RepID=UPI00129511B9|nr:T6SS immunity protein Tdi1 domain-containing protein [Nocardia aurantia]
MIEPVAMDEAMPGWAPYFHQFDTVVGYSDLGHIFLAGRDTGEHGVLHPYRSAAKSYGIFADTTRFVSEVVQDPGFVAYVLQPDHVAAIRDLLGPLGPEQVYIPQPYPFLGGTEEPDTYTTGDVWVFLDLVAQFQSSTQSEPER